MIRNGKRTLAGHSQHHGLPETPDYAQTQCVGLNVLGFGGRGDVGLFVLIISYYPIARACFLHSFW